MKSVLTVLYAMCTIFSTINAATSFSANNLERGIVWAFCAVTWLVCSLLSLGDS